MTTIDLNAKDIDKVSIQTAYCTTRENHDFQVMQCLKRNLPPIPTRKPEDRLTEPLAVVCSGPSLSKTWAELREFNKILSCSGAHNYLIERGIIPTYHSETDPRPHKSVFVKPPHKDVMYLIASSCHPEVFDTLKDFDTRIWHVFGYEDLSNYPRGHWCITGGANVGLRALVIARLLGYVNIHIFGMDCCSDESAIFHTGHHPNEPKEKARMICKIGDKQFITTQVFLEYARQFFKETIVIPDAQFTLHGEGLLQELALRRFNDPAEVEKRKTELARRGNSCIAMTLPQTISPDYARLNHELHEQRMDYGIGGSRHTKTVLKLKQAIKAESVLDYGCGKALLAKRLPFPIWNYDPAIPEYSKPPRPADLVVCTDVLEHIEPEFMDATLADISRCVKKVGYFVIHTGPAGKCLPDGRNTHLSQHNKEWWINKLREYFTVPDKAVSEVHPQLFIVVGPKIVQAKAA